MKETQKQKALRLIEKHGVLRANEFIREGIPSAVLGRLVEQGKLMRVDRGIYTLPEPVDITENHDLVQVVKRIPNGVVCLISALEFHGLTTQIPHEIWVAIDVKARKPGFEYPPVHIVRFSGKALTHGVEKHVLEGIEVGITTPAKTVADCFKYRNKIGLDIAIEALRDALRNRVATADEIWNAAKVCRVASVMKPYLQALS